MEVNSRVLRKEHEYEVETRAAWLFLTAKRNACPAVGHLFICWMPQALTDELMVTLFFSRHLGMLKPVKIIRALCMDQIGTCPLNRCDNRLVKQELTRQWYIRSRSRALVAGFHLTTFLRLIDAPDN